MPTRHCSFVFLLAMRVLQ